MKINFDAQLAKLEEQVPDPEAFDTIGVFPALDACMAMMSLIQGIQAKSAEEIANVGRLSENSVTYFVEVSLAESDDEITANDIAAHPLMQWEVAMQNEVFDRVKEAPENKQTCKSLKAMVLEEGLSNLGLEISNA